MCVCVCVCEHTYEYLYRIYITFLNSSSYFRHIRIRTSKSKFKMITTHFLVHQWRRLILILSKHEKILEEKIQPKGKSKIMQERIQDLKNQIKHFRLYLICVRNIPEALLNAEARLNQLGLDIYNTGNLSGVDFSIKIVKSLRFQLQHIQHFPQRIK